ncbi:MAG: two-component system response regulator, partial [Opitutaceae bacterium]|nr:two-component system response regulator [Verrucomicrobiales bacterium]
MNTLNSESVQAAPHRILVVDDNRAIHDDFRKILGSDITGDEFDSEEAEMFGPSSCVSDKVHFDLDFASQGREALDRVLAAGIAGRPYSVVFMDVRMPPGWDG